MSTEIKNDTNGDKYLVTSVDETDLPEGILVGHWYRYVIGQGNSKIEGFKPGSLESVTEHAEKVVEDLNERAKSFGQTAYYHVTRQQK